MLGVGIRLTFITMTPLKERLLPHLSFSFARSGGKGGQHVNKVATKAILVFDLGNSDLSDTQKQLLREKLSTYLTQADTIQLQCDATRSQLKNKEIVLKRLYSLIQAALTPPKPRKPTKVPWGVKQERLQDKKRQSEKKANRRKNWD